MSAALRPMKSVAVAIVIGVLVGACSATAGGRDTLPDAAVMCAKCKVVWVAPLDPADSNVPTYAAEGWMHECPDCHAAAVSYFRTGRFEHTCESCGDALVHCTEHPD